MSMHVTELEYIPVLFKALNIICDVTVFQHFIYNTRKKVNEFKISNLCLALHIKK
jgi:hypothetical protein